MQDFQFSTSAALAEHLAKELAERMRHSIRRKGRVAIAVSGGRTPIQFFQHLAAQPLAWERVSITLVDERWLDPNDEASNQYLVHRYLLQGEAANAWFVPLKTTALTPKAGFMECETRLSEQIPELDYAVLGMGLDGHTASWFPRSKALNSIFSRDSGALCYPVEDAPEFARMTLSWTALSKCKALFLHFEGEEKNVTFDIAMNLEQKNEVTDMPVRFLFNQHQVPVLIYRTDRSSY